MARHAWLVAVGLVLSACGCVLDKPLSDPNTSQVDERLLGRWVGRSTPGNPDAAQGHLFIGRHAVEGNPAGLMESIVIGYDDEGRKILDAPLTRPAYFSVTHIGGHDFINVYAEEDVPAPDEHNGTILSDLSKPAGYAAWTTKRYKDVMLWRYTVEGDRLKLYFIDPAKTKPLVRSGELTRENKLLTAESLSAYIEKHGPEGLFLGEKDAAMFDRVK